MDPSKRRKQSGRGATAVLRGTTATAQRAGDITRAESGTTGSWHRRTAWWCRRRQQGVVDAGEAGVHRPLEHDHRALDWSVIRLLKRSDTNSGASPASTTPCSTADRHHHAVRRCQEVGHRGRRRTQGALIRKIRVVVYSLRSGESRKPWIHGSDDGSGRGATAVLRGTTATARAADVPAITRARSGTTGYPPVQPGSALSGSFTLAEHRPSFEGRVPIAIRGVRFR